MNARHLMPVLALIVVGTSLPVSIVPHGRPSGSRRYDGPSSQRRAALHQLHDANFSPRVGFGVRF